MPGEIKMIQMSDATSEKPTSRPTIQNVNPSNDSRPPSESRILGPQRRPVLGVMEQLDITCQRAGALTCVSDSRRALTYRDLRTEILTVASALQNAGVRPGDLVGVRLHRSVEVFVVVLALWKLRAVFLPVDPTYPAERTRHMLNDSKCRFVVGRPAAEQGENPPGKAKELNVENLLTFAPPGAAPRANTLRPDFSADEVASGATVDDDVAYIIYTSGSTGKPKGVVVTHLNLSTYLAGLDVIFDAKGENPTVPTTKAAQQRWLCPTSISFDLSVPELWWTSTRGHRLFVQEGKGDGSDGLPSTTDLLDQHAISHLQTTPSYTGMLLQSPKGEQAVGRLETLLLGGEPVPAALALRVTEQFSPRGARLINMYGPTETTGASSWADLQPSDCRGTSVPIGLPLLNEEVLILAEDGTLQPQGGLGEIVVGGDKVTRGYLGREELTKEKFVPHPLEPNATVYRTGDLGYLGDDGKLYCRGRIDRQVKVRGFRVELGEVEALLEKHPRVVSAAARVFADDNTNILVGYVIVDGDVPIERDLRLHMNTVAPPAFVPSAIVVLDAFPLAPTGKTAFDQLPHPDDVKSTAATPTENLSSTEATVLDVWRRALALGDIHIGDNFFDLGGHSLIAIKMLSELNATFDVALTVDALFASPTVRSLAARIDAKDEGDVESSALLVDITSKCAGRPPFFCVHGAGGNVMNFHALAQALEDDVSVVGIQAVGIDGLTAPLASIEEMSTRYLAEVLARQPQGPYFLGGYSGGGVVAYDMAQRLIARGETVAALVMFDSYPPGVEYRSPPLSVRLARAARGGLPFVKERVAHRIEYSAYRLSTKVNALVAKARGTAPDFETRDRILMDAFINAEANYVAHPYDGEVLLLSTASDRSRQAPDHEWTKFVKHLRVIRVPGDHDDLLTPEHFRGWVGELASTLHMPDTAS